ncbi:hypothetical protein AB4Z46_28260 [Variovorax sp. M-6]|uniref:hypothetical protein n=1 Tax=Variovorax sp. M-6 TaxID=3233041 RepID=UPI003F9BCDED
MLAQPEFSEAGTSAGSLWARFTDGRYFLLIDDWKPVAAPSLGLQKIAGDRAASEPRLTTSKSLQVPGSEKALLLRLQEDTFSREGDQSISKGHKAHEDRGWKVEPDHAEPKPSRVFIGDSRPISTIRGGSRSFSFRWAGNVVHAPLQGIQCRQVKGRNGADEGESATRRWVMPTRWKNRSAPAGLST